jgi:membrane protein YdbS with pleckstrin-like domain
MSDSNSSQQQTSWIYEGVWGMLTNVFCVPRVAPVLPTIDREEIVSRKPSPGFVRYLKLQFYIGLAIAIIVLSVGSIIVVAATENAWFLIGSVAVAAIVGLFSIISYLAIHLRFDTTWYVFSDRSMRLRRGIWLIRESTITFENIQNVKVTQGPVQRFFGIADVVVETAGGGGAQAEPGAGLGMHAGLIEGVAEAAQIRDSIMSRVRLTSTTGLGDESGAEGQGGWPACHLTVLREIRDLAQQASA